MQDYLIRGTALQGKVRVLAVQTRSLVEQLRQRHGTWPTATAALGRTASAGAMMGAMLKGDEKLTIQVKGDGPIGQIVIDANAKGEVRGYVDEPKVHLPSNALGKLDVAGAVGTEGFLNITKDLGMKEPYRGSVPIVSGELAEDFTYYFAKSEQTPSAVALGVLVEADNSVRASGGFIIQLLPGLTDKDISQIETQLSEQRPVTEMLDQGLTLEEMMKEVLPSFEVLENREVHFRCKCSHERVEQTLISLGKAELESILDEDGQAEVVCHFCNEKYQYSGTDLENLLEKISANR
jgi:molecular chaperone Hsp33